MSDEYQLRKDIDRLTLLVNELQKNQNNPNSDTNKSNQKLNDRLTGLYDGLTHFSTTLIKLRDNLIDFNQELIDFDDDNENFGEDLGQLKNNLHSFIVAVNSLSTTLTQLDESVEGLDEDIFGENGLDEALTALSTVVGDNDSGLVKGLNDLNDDVFGTGGLSDNIFGDNGLGEQLQALSDVINDPNTGLATQVTGLDNRVFGSNGLSDSIFGTNGLATRIITAEGGLSRLTSSLDVLSTFLTEFEGELDNFETALENDPDIDTSQLNSTIVALFGVIADVKGNVTSVEGELGDVSDSFGAVKSNLYGTKLDDDGNEIPKEPTDTADSTSLKGHLTTLKDVTVPNVQGTLYGTGANNSPTNPATNSVIGKANAVQSNLYGTKTVNGQTVPKTPSDEPSENSVKGHLDTLREDTVPAVQDALFGADSDGTIENPSDNSTMGKIKIVKNDFYGTGTAQNPQQGSFKYLMNEVKDEKLPAVQTRIFGESTTPFNITNINFVQFSVDTTNVTGTGILEFRVYPSSSVDIRTVVATGLSNGDFSNGLTGWETNDATKVVKLTTTSGVNLVRFTAEPIDDSVNVKTLKQSLNFDNVNTITFYAKLGTSSTLAENNGILVIFTGKDSDYASGVLPIVDVVYEDTGVMKGHVENFNTILHGENEDGLISQVEGAIEKIGDENTPNSLSYKVKSSLDAIGDVSDFTGADISSAIATNQTEIGSTQDKIGDTSFTGSTISGALNTAQGDITKAQSDIGTVGVNDGSLQTQITQLPSYIQKIWCCTQWSEDEITKLPSVGSGRIGIEFTELARKTIRDYGEVNFSLKIVSPTNQVYTSPPAQITDPNIVSNVRYFYYTFTEFGLYTIFCENLVYTLQVGEVTDAVGTLSLAKAPTTIYGLTVSIFSDGLSVYMAIDGTLNGDSALPSGGNVASLGYLDTSKDVINPDFPSSAPVTDLYFYSPYEEIHTPTHTSTNDVSKFILTSSGELKMLNMGGKNATVKATFYYPLRKRIKIHDKVITTSSSPFAVASGGNCELYGELKYEHGVLIPNSRVHFFVKED